MIKNKILLFTLATLFYFNLNLFAGLENGLELTLNKEKININETYYEFLVYDRKQENDEPVGMAEYTVYKKLDSKSNEEKEELLMSECEMKCIDAEFPETLLNASTIIHLSYIFIDADYRKNGLGSHLFLNGLTTLQKKYPHGIMVWTAEPIGEKKITIDQLRNFYNKQKGCPFFDGKDFSYYYLSLSALSKKRTLHLLNEENSTAKRIKN